jgi:hypothetical protein
VRHEEETEDERVKVAKLRSIDARKDDRSALEREVRGVAQDARKDGGGQKVVDQLRMYRAWLTQAAEQKVVQFRRHTVMLIANARAQVSHIHEKTEGVSIAFVVACLSFKTTCCLAML